MRGAARPYNGDTGKSAEGERVAEGLVVAMKRSNFRGTKRLTVANDSDKRKAIGE